MNVSQVMADPSVLIPTGGITFGGVGVWALLLTVVVALVRIWPAIRKLQNESDASLRTDLMRRVTELEMRLKDEQRDCERQIASLQAKLEGVTRQFIAFQIAVGQAVPPSTRTPEMERALRSLDRIISEGRETQEEPKQ